MSYDDRENTDLRLWEAMQRREYQKFRRNEAVISSKNKNSGNKNIDNSGERGPMVYSAMTQRRIKALESIRFPWKSTSTPKNDVIATTVDDWSQLFVKMREKGIIPNIKAKTHWFEGQSLIQAGMNNEEEAGKRGGMLGLKRRTSCWNFGTWEKTVKRIEMGIGVEKGGKVEKKLHTIFAVLLK